MNRSSEFGRASEIHLPLDSAVAVVPIIGTGDSREIVLDGNFGNPQLIEGRVDARRVELRQGLLDGEMVTLDEPRVQELYFEDGSRVPETITGTVDRLAGSVGTRLRRPRVLAYMNGVTVLTGPGEITTDKVDNRMHMRLDLDEASERMFSGEIADGKILAVTALLLSPKVDDNPSQLDLPIPRTMGKKKRTIYDSLPPVTYPRRVRVNFNRKGNHLGRM